MLGDPPERKLQGQASVCPVQCPHTKALTCGAPRCAAGGVWGGRCKQSGQWPVPEPQLHSLLALRLQTGHSVFLTREAGLTLRAH